MKQQEGCFDSRVGTAFLYHSVYKIHEEAE